MTSKSSRRKQTRNSLDSETSERARIIAAFTGLLVEQSIRKMDFGKIAAAADVSLAQLREELGSTIAVLAAHVEQIDRLVLAGENVEMAERTHGLAMLLTSVLRAWLEGEDPDLARTMSAIERAGAWTAARRLPRPRLPHSGVRLAPTPPTTASCRPGQGRAIAQSAARKRRKSSSGR
jgi:AcrR family transcriptional regulator